MLRLFLVVFAMSAVGCKTSESTVSSTEAALGQNLVFVGCVPSLGECRNSCAGQDGQGQVDPERCPDQDSPVACGCPGGGGEPPVKPDPSEYTFVGCVPSPGECQFSCPTKQMITYRGGDGCFSAEEFSCFCKN